MNEANVNTLYSVDGETFIFDSKIELFQAMDSKTELHVGAEYFSAQVRPIVAEDFTPAQYIIEQLDEDLFMMADEGDKEFKLIVDGEGETELNKIIQEWIKKHVTIPETLKMLSERVHAVTIDDINEFIEES